jgi:iron complex transport system substrate-binding protein
MSNLQNGECVTSYDADTDYFPEKLNIETAEYFTVEYFNHYKIVNNLAAGEKIVLYQCGTPEPTVADATATIAIPVTKVGSLATPHISFIEVSVVYK